MSIFSSLSKNDHEQLVFCQDQSAGLRAIIAIHDTTLGPALGGTRMWPYANEEEAIIDALRLARGMTYKSAAAGLNLGGGKAVIIGDPNSDKRETLFRAFGRFVESLGGRYITAEDVGTGVDDMEFVLQETRHVCGLGSLAQSSGDPSPVTALGVWQGIKACANTLWGEETLQGKTIAIQGLGNVGSHLVKHLFDDGAKLIVTDIIPAKVDRIVADCGAEQTTPEEIYDVPCDIFVPAALGAVLNSVTIPRLKCRLIAGPANNQLATDLHGDSLHERGILYAPDYIINAGGVINVADELKGGYHRQRALHALGIIRRNLIEIMTISQRDNVPTYKVANWIAERRIEALGKIKNTYLPRTGQ